MSFGIGAAPRGLVSLLELADLGAVPRVLVDQVSSTIDLTPFYLTFARETVIQQPPAVNRAVVGTYLFPDLVVPVGELWWVHQYSVNTSPLVAGATARIRPIYQEASGLALAVGPSSSAVAGEALRPYSDVVPFIATSGAQFGVFVEAVTGGGVDVSAGILISRLRS